MPAHAIFFFAGKFSENKNKKNEKKVVHNMNFKISTNYFNDYHMNSHLIKLLYYTF